MERSPVQKRKRKKGVTKLLVNCSRMAQSDGVVRVNQFFCQVSSTEGRVCREVGLQRSVDDGGGCVSGLFTCADGDSRADGEEGKRGIRTQTQSATGGEKKR